MLYSSQILRKKERELNYTRRRNIRIFENHFRNVEFNYWNVVERFKNLIKYSCSKKSEIWAESFQSEQNIFIILIMKCFIQKVLVTRFSKITVGLVPCSSVLVCKNKRILLIFELFENFASCLIAFMSESTKIIIFHLRCQKSNKQMCLICHHKFNESFQIDDETYMRISVVKLRCKQILLLRPALDVVAWKLEDESIKIFIHER